MPINYYGLLSLEELIRLYNQLIQIQTTGAITEVAAAGVRTVKTLVSNNVPVEDQLERVLWAMYLKAPEDYPNPYANKITRVRAHYTGSL